MEVIMARRWSRMEGKVADSVAKRKLRSLKSDLELNYRLF
jgi:hypothetical protein